MRFTLTPWHLPIVVIGSAALGRTLYKGSKFAKMKELRPTVNKVEWRVAFAFDTNSEAFSSRPGRRAARRTPSSTGG